MTLVNNGPNPGLGRETLKATALEEPMNCRIQIFVFVLLANRGLSREPTGRSIFYVNIDVNDAASG